MRIAILAIYIRGADAIGLQLIEWSRRFLQQGHELRLFVEQIGPGAPEDLLKITTVTEAAALPHSPDWGFLQSAALVICDYPAYFGLAECLRLLGGPAILFNYHGVTPPELWTDPEGKAFLERSQRRAALVHFADLAIAHSEFAREELHGLTGYPLDRIRVIPYIVPPAENEQRPPGAAEGPPVILFVGRLAAHKRPQLLVEALALVREEIPEAKLVLAGEVRGTAHAPVVAEVQRRAHALGLEKAVHFTGPVEHSLADHLYARANLLASASAHEGFCIPVAEAMARGVPVVALAAGAIAETMGAGGILVDGDDVAGLAAAIKAVLSDPELRRRLGEDGRGRAAGYRADVVMDQVQKAFAALPPPTRRPPGIPRLGQRVDLSALDAAAEVAPPSVAPSGSLPVVGVLLAKLRRWLQSDLYYQLDLLTRRQVAYNRQVAQALQALDELSATISEREAARALHRGDELSVLPATDSVQGQP